MSNYKPTPEADYHPAGLAYFSYYQGRLDELAENKERSTLIPSDTPQKVLRWVKASERLPEKDGQICIRSHGVDYSAAWVRTRKDNSRIICGMATQKSEWPGWKKNLEWLEEAAAPAAQSALEKDKVIALIKLYQRQIPEEKYDWEEHVRDLDNIIFDIENNLQPTETPAPGEDQSITNSRQFIPAEALEKIEKCAECWNDDIRPHFYKAMCFGYLLAIGKLPLYHWSK